MKFEIQKTTPLPGVIYLKFKTQYETCSTFMRLQEFYESPFEDIRGKFFTLEQFMDRYAAQQGNFTYTLDWGGFNVPGHIVNNFVDTFASDVLSPLLEKEQALIDQIFEIDGMGNLVSPDGNYYVIGLYDEDSLDHELAHAMYYLNVDYRQKVDALVKALPKGVYTTVEKWLLLKGYSQPQVVDEINAYLTTDGEQQLTSRFGKRIGKRDYSEFVQAFESASGRKLPVFKAYIPTKGKRKP